jgi:hypothetical protein
VTRSYKYLIVNWASHIAHAAFAIAQKNRAEAAFGPLKSSLGFHPFKLESLAAPYGKCEAYSESYYWKQYVSLPQFGDFAESGLLFRTMVKTRAAVTTFRVLAVAGLAALVLRKRRHFFLSIKNQKVRGLTLGAQVLSDFLRNDSVSRGHLEISRSFVRILYECYVVAHYWLDVSPGRNFRELLFSDPEVTYRNEIARRALLKRGASEIFADRWRQGQFTLATSHRFGCELVLCRASVQAAADVESARKDLIDRLSGNSKYVYMGEDVYSRPVIPAATDSSPRKNLGPKAVVFLHAVSDAQFCCGDDDCFADLDDWLDCSLNMLLEKGYDVYFKPHPRTFSAYTSKQYPVERRYMSYLADRKGLDWTGLAEGQIASARGPRIWVVDYRAGIAALKEALGTFLAITHHGTIATEAVGLRVPVVWSNTNPARNFPDFGFSYRNISEYGELLDSFREGHLVVDDRRFDNCLQYLAATKNDYYTVIWTEFSRLAGKNIFTDPDIYENLVLSANPDTNPKAHATVRELYGGGSLNSLAIWNTQEQETAGGLPCAET